MGDWDVDDSVVLHFGSVSVKPRIYQDMIASMILMIIVVFRSLFDHNILKYDYFPPPPPN